MDNQDERSIFITGMNPDKSYKNERATKDALQEALQKQFQRSAKVDVEEVIFPMSSSRRDVVMATFQDKWAAKRICDLKSFELNGTKVSVFPKPPEPLIELQGIIPNQFLKCLEDKPGSKSQFIKSLKDVGVNCVPTGSDIVIKSDNYKAFKDAQNHLEDFMEKNYLSQKSTHSVPVLKHSRSVSGTESMDHGIPSRRQHRTPSGGGFQRSASLSESSKVSTTEFSSSKDGTGDEETPELTVNSDIFAYIKHVFGEEIKKIEMQYNVKFTKNVSGVQGSNCKIDIEFNGKSCDQSKNVQEAKDKLITLYQKHYHSIQHRTFKSDKESKKLLSAAAEAQMKHPKVFTKMSAENHVIFFAPSSKHLEAAENTVKCVLGMEVSNPDSDSDEEDEMEISTTTYTAPAGRKHGRRHGSKLGTSAPVFTDSRDHHSYRWDSDTEYASPSSKTHSISGSIKEKQGRLQINTREGVTIKIYRGDLTAEKTDAIVNAANEHLKHIGGLAQAILRKAGNELQRESDKYVRSKGGSVYEGSAIPTKGYWLPCSHVIHAVGPRWDNYRDKKKCIDCLQQTFMNCLKCADEELKVESIAIPAVSSGIFGVPKKVCAETVFDAVAEFLGNPSRRGSLQEIRLVNIDAESTDLMKEEFKKRWPKTHTGSSSWL